MVSDTGQPMPSLNLEISKIGPESDLLLRNLFEHYCYDMSEFFEVDTGPDGSYSWDTASIWEKGSDAYLARAGASIAGFAVIGSGAEWLGSTGTHDVREFFIMRRFRRCGFGRSMAAFLWNEYPGEWLVRVFEGNALAIPFWRNAVSRYASGSYREERRVVHGRPWRFFRLVSTGADPSGG
jgi:predicted acetyltransferase